ncbi:ATP-binding protein [Nonomuraea pusilla]|uniref:sensor histidine kinase n=1 Tax=Nonomuraea pusilla TaxID=46177 RepID=UPI00331D7108
MSLWARSLRGRVTIIATAIAALVFIPVAVAAGVMARALVTSGVHRDTRDVAEQVAAELREGRLAPDGSIAVRDPAVDLIQVVAADGRIVATSDAARNLPRLSRAEPRGGVQVVSTRTCLPSECVYLSAVRVGAGGGDPVVYAARSAPDILASHSLEVITLAQAGALIVLTGWATWLVTGRALRPVATLRAELDAVEASDLSRRVTEPPGEDELAQLARSVNRTLARLERSAEQQRQFASDASHELRTPIAGLRAQLESAQLYPAETDVESLVKSTLRDTDRLEAIISDLLLLARIGSRMDTAHEPVDLACLVRQELAGRGDTVPVRADLADGVVVRGVRLQLARVLANLLDNAQRHAETGVRVSVSREGDTAVLAVENDGAQIAPADRERIFERFTRLDAARSRDAGGTGLGLAIARDVAMAHRGQVRVEDCRGGARFVLRLPAVE